MSHNVGHGHVVPREDMVKAGCDGLPGCPVCRYERDVLALSPGLESSKPAESAGLYFHIGNSGFTFSVEDTGSGPVLRVEAGAFGHQMLSSQMFTTREGLKELGEFLVAQGERQFSRPYCHATEMPELIGAKNPRAAAGLSGDGPDLIRPQGAAGIEHDAIYGKFERSMASGSVHVTPPPESLGEEPTRASGEPSMVYRGRLMYWHFNADELPYGALDITTRSRWTMLASGMDRLMTAAPRLDEDT